MTTLLSLIGNTPVMRLNRIHPDPHVALYAKLEGQSIGGSVKDRIALFMIRDAEERGILTARTTILEATSGNTGIALAMIAAAKGYRLTLTMAENASAERKKILRAYGADVVETPANLGTAGAIQKVHELLAEHPGRYWYVNQHANIQNPRAHEETTAREILMQVPDITHFVAGMGTFGTLLGTGRGLRKHRAGIRIIGVEPENRIDGLRNMKEPHAPAHFDTTFLDATIPVTREQAVSTMRTLAKQEGLLCGVSSGANLFGALQTAKDIARGTIVVLLPDRGEKYLSTEVYL